MNRPEPTSVAEIFFNSSVDLLCTVGPDGYFVEMNPAWERTLGWSIGELKSKPFIEFVHPDDRERTLAEAQRLQEPGTVAIDFENRYIHKGGFYRTLSWTASQFPEGVVLIASARDVTEQRQVEQELRRLVAAVEACGIAIANTDVAGVFTAWNAAAEGLFGWTRREVVGRSIDRLLVPADLRDEEEDLSRRALAGAVLTTKTERLHKDGRRIPVEMSAASVNDDQGRSMGIVRVFRRIDSARPPA